MSPPTGPETAPSGRADPPLARVDEAPAFSAIWAVPIIAAALAAVLAWQAWGARGVRSGL